MENRYVPFKTEEEEINLNNIRKEFYNRTIEQYSYSIKNNLVRSFTHEKLKNLEFISFHFPIFNIFNINGIEKLSNKELASTSKEAAEKVLRDERIYSEWKYVEIQPKSIHSILENRICVLLSQRKPKWYEKININFLVMRYFPYR